MCSTMALHYSLVVLLIGITACRSFLHPSLYYSLSATYHPTNTHGLVHKRRSRYFLFESHAVNGDSDSDRNGNDIDIDINFNADKEAKEEESGISFHSSQQAHAPLSGYTTSKGYSTVLIKRLERWEQRLKKREDVAKERTEDGYEQMFPSWIGSLWWKKILFLPLYLKKNFLLKKAPGTLILVRHGESQWNANKTFTGWADPDLSVQGLREAEHAARLLLAGGYDIDVVFTSRLKRAIRTTWIILQELNEIYIPVFKSWRLNERMYGALTGLGKQQTAEQLGQELVQTWRGSLKARPPPLTQRDEHWPGRDRKYFDLEMDQIPLTESLEDCMDRTGPIWEQKIKYELRMGRNVMVAAHANTLRGLVKIIDEIGDDEIQDVAIPTGIPIIYKFDKEMNAILPSDGDSVVQSHMRGVFLEKPGLLKEAMKREEEWCERVPGYDSTMTETSRPMTPLERSLAKLNAERELGKWAGQFIDPNAELEDDGNDGNAGSPIRIIQDEDEVWEERIRNLEEGKFDPDGPVFQDAPAAGVVKKNDKEDDDEEPIVKPSVINQPCITSLPSASTVPSLPLPTRKDNVLVIIRHGKTEHNKLGLFTGWEDVPLAQDGIDEAREAGLLLKKHGFEFDVVYTSWLSRAVETAWYVMDELDCLWLPIIKSWRLNERMYGDLTGLSKNMVNQRHGEKQFKAWRRGYKVRPPSVSSFSKNYPGNDKRYQKYTSDIRYSVRESAIRSIEKGRVSIHRKLPKSESLKDCMDRTIPYFSQQIVPEAINQGKRVLISSSENAIRGLLMHLCDIPEEHITELEIPNGLPLIFDMKSKCVKLLDDGTGRDPLEVYNFGKGAKYLFRPCENEDGTPDEECDIRFMSNALWNDGSIILSDNDRETLEKLKRPFAPTAELTDDKTETN